MLELHHIMFRSEVPNHPKKHSRINTVLLCRDHHEWLHRKKDNRNFLIIQRKLWESFPDEIRKEHYLERKLDDSANKNTMRML